MYTAKLRTPFAVLQLESNGSALTHLAYLPLTERVQAPADEVTEQAAREVERYLADPHFRFSVPLATSGTGFQQRVWTAIAAIPPGEYRAYTASASGVGTRPTLSLAAE